MPSFRSLIRSLIKTRLLSTQMIVKPSYSIPFDWNALHLGRGRSP